MIKDCPVWIYFCVVKIKIVVTCNWSDEKQQHSCLFHIFFYESAINFQLFSFLPPPHFFSILLWLQSITKYHHFWKARERKRQRYNLDKRWWLTDLVTTVITPYSLLCSKISESYRTVYCLCRAAFTNTFKCFNFHY